MFKGLLDRIMNKDGKYAIVEERDVKKRDYEKIRPELNRCVCGFECLYEYVRCPICGSKKANAHANRKQRKGEARCL